MTMETVSGSSVLSRETLFARHAVSHELDALFSMAHETFARLVSASEPCCAMESRESRDSLSVVSRCRSTSLASLSLPLGERLRRLETREPSAVVLTLEVVTGVRAETARKRPLNYRARRFLNAVIWSRPDAPWRDRSGESHGTASAATGSAAPLHASGECRARWQLRTRRLAGGVDAREARGYGRRCATLRAVARHAPWRATEMSLAAGASNPIAVLERSRQGLTGWRSCESTAPTYQRKYQLESRDGIDPD